MPTAAEIHALFQKLADEDRRKRDAKTIDPLARNGELFLCFGAPSKIIRWPSSASTR